ncbi:MAG: transposase [Rhodoferax sp.]|nr:transposase [Rhodoferax sp.]
MRYIFDILRLKLQQHHSHQHIADALGISKGVVTKYVKLASKAGLQWPQIQTLDETALHTRLMGTPQRASSFVAPDYGHLHQELGRKGMTLMLLWQEHSESHPGESVHSYSQFCENYRRFAKTLKRSMRQIHRAGQKMFIDNCGPTVALTSGERAQIFVSALGASGYTFAYATARETTADWLGATAQALRFYGGCVELIVPDNPLILYRVMRSRLRDSHSQISPERALDKLRRIQHQVVKVNDLEPIAALSSINQEHTEILQALTIKKPTLPAQLTLL